MSQVRKRLIALGLRRGVKASSCPTHLAKIKKAFDPISSRQNTLLLTFVDELRQYDVKNTESYKSLLGAVKESFQQAIEDIQSRGQLDVPHITPTAAQKVAAFQTRNVWAGIKVCSLSLFLDFCYFFFFFFLLLTPFLSFSSS